MWLLHTQGLERLVTEHNVSGVHGRLVDLIDCAPQLSTAVEVTAGVDSIVRGENKCGSADHCILSSDAPPSSSGNQLFHVVVETDDVAMRCSELLVQYKLGRVSFMPLNTLKASEVERGAGIGQRDQRMWGPSSKILSFQGPERSPFPLSTVPVPHGVWQ